MTRYLINSNPEKGDGVKEGVKDKTNSRDASASKKMLGPKRKYFQTVTDIISSEQLRKLEKIKPFGHSKAPKKKKL